MILITGATGFLGHHLLPRLLDAGYSLRALVRPSSNTAFLQQLGIELAVVPDVSDETAVLTAMQGCDQVIHAAGHFRFWGDLQDFWQTNVAGTQAVLSAAQRVGVSRFVHISTVAVVGKTPAQGEIDETTPCQPLDPYQQTKLEGEQLALSYHQQHGLPVIVLRPGAFYGPWGHYAFNRLFFTEPLRGWRIKVDNGRHITFPVFVPDVAQAIHLALTRGRPGQVYNISGPSLSHNDINAIVSDLAGISHWRMNVPSTAVLLLARAWTTLSRITRREPFYPINMAPYVFQDWRVTAHKAQQELGFIPTPIADGIKATLEWYRESNKRGY
ncbi:MAG: NAD-dependent epimerase/dehydratase family protein [Anaerolineales bacterium]|nr:NAD-dependent epimerase/dehydratase family protein [Anaerolineales bacterium]MCB8989684.1 NAD-dependent epimerase/dehydratase family protein [Ardenticatenaceae bacterium]MCB9002857.1 NAD-dependent epimerase/dehydratase family protein [Ardenticatenaceae bacterium]